jgi:hypothetical protein
VPYLIKILNCTFWSIYLYIIVILGPKNVGLDTNISIATGNDNNVNVRNRGGHFEKWLYFPFQ